MQSIHATYRDGQLELLQPVDWPNGTRAEVIPLTQNSNCIAPAVTIWPANYFQDTACAFAGESFERPAQGELPARDDW